MASSAIGGGSMVHRLDFDLGLHRLAAAADGGVSGTISADIHEIWRRCKQTAFLTPLTLLFIHKFDISVFKIAISPILIANKIFHVTVVLLVYFCDQFVAPDIRHSRRRCSVCQQSTSYSATRTRF